MESNGTRGLRGKTQEEVVETTTVATHLISEEEHSFGVEFAFVCSTLLVAAGKQYVPSTIFQQLKFGKILRVSSM